MRSLKRARPVSLRLDWATHAAAKFACENWHYSKKIPVNKLAKVGVWENDKFIGVVIFSCGSAGCSSYSKSLGIKNTEIAELARVALTKHSAPVTKIIGIAVRMIRRKMPGLKVLVSYADREQKHVGTIYQAGNWSYVGLSSKDVAYIDRTGKRHHSRNVSESGWKVHCGVRARCPRPSQMRKIDVPPKHKYLMSLDQEMKQKISIISKPYPKRAPEAEASMRSSSTREIGGSSPTSALQFKEANGQA